MNGKERNEKELKEMKMSFLFQKKLRLQSPSLHLFRNFTSRTRTEQNFTETKENRL